MTADTSDDRPDRTEALRAAATAVERGDLVVYPTETVYGLGADALDAAAVERVFELKGRDRDDPLSLGVASVDDALRYTRPTELAVAFARAFLPGPVTVVVERDDRVPDALTAGRDRVGIRVPDHEIARALLAETGPLTATSANVSGTGSVTRPDDLGDRIRGGVAAVIDGGETPGTESTVVDPETGEIHRRGAMAGAIEAWLADPPVEG
ncbi:L-threonylcarbamoyladenylate synthase [Halorubrum tebenquichense]|uniref:L-threonylcarbamoyladenylate synthase n=1 Tax=Halorubrum tebenquichense DSM 14210 TaxID=1227485 RepID=M0DRT0_9EURY|nr:L-threonylcarbamoyladenylate synthase [Halorubrum tebenquichense]ELZ36849.1 Sua5/YciO/YrdC/YwlC family protein [Halorubrum tebenquichense DSM 14210]